MKLLLPIFVLIGLCFIQNEAASLQPRSPEAVSDVTLIYLFQLFNFWELIIFQPWSQNFFHAFWIYDFRSAVILPKSTKEPWERGCTKEPGNEEDYCHQENFKYENKISGNIILFLIIHFIFSNRNVWKKKNNVLTIELFKRKLGRELVTKVTNARLVINFV